MGKRIALFSVLNIETRTEIARIKTEPLPDGMVSSADGKFVYVTSFGDQKPAVSAIDTQNLNIAWITRLEGRVLGYINASISPDGKSVYTGLDELESSSFGKVAIIDTEKRDVIEYFPVGPLPRDMEITPDGNFMFLASYRGHSVPIIDLNSRQVIYEIKDLNISGPYELAMTADGKRIFIVSAQSNSIVVADITIH